MMAAKVILLPQLKWAVADEDDDSSGELLVVSADSSSVRQCASSASADCDMSFSTGCLLDSARSYHMCTHREWFATYDPLNGGSVSMGNDTQCRVLGIGTVRFRMYDGMVRTLTDVRTQTDAWVEEELNIIQVDRKGQNPQV